MSKRILGLFAFIVIICMPFFAFAQGTSTKEDVKTIVYNIGGSNTNNGVDCFDYYRFGRTGWVDISLNARNKTYKAGDTITFIGQINNPSSLPLTGMGLYAQLYRNNTSTSQHFHGDYLIDEFFALDNISVNSSSSKEIEFVYQIPSGLKPGRYFVGSNLITNRQFNVLGVAFLGDSYYGRAFFDVINDNPSEVYFARDKVFLNDKLYKQQDFAPEFQLDDKKEYNIKYSLNNDSKYDQQIKLTKTLYSWDNYSEKNKINSKEENVLIKAESSGDFKDDMPQLKGGVYMYEVIAQTPTSKSVMFVRWAVHSNDIPGRISFSSLSNFPLKKGDKAFIFDCFQSVSNYFRYSGKIISTLKDKSGKQLAKTEYQSDDITPNIMAQKSDFVADNDYNDLTLETIFYDKDNNIVDQSTLKYDCSSFSSALSKLDLSVKNGEVIIKPIDICGQQTESKISLEIKDSKKQTFYVEAIPSTKEFRKKLDFKDGETYQIFAMTSMKVMAKINYTHHAQNNNFNIAYIVITILAVVIISLIFLKIKKQKSVPTIFFILAFFIFFASPNVSKATAPTAPSITGPGSSITGVPADGKWTMVPNATKYKWSIRAGSCSGTVIASGEQAGPSVSIGASMDVWSGSTYYLCVQACNSSNECSGIVGTSFKASINPSASSPSNGGNITDYNMKLDWTDSTGVYGYKYQICEDQYCSTVLASGDITASEIALKDTGLKAWDKTKYYWMVKACADSGYTKCMTNWTRMYYFNNRLIPGYVSPTNGTFIKSTPITLDWTDITNAGGYEYRICKTSFCNSFAENGSTTDSTVDASGSNLDWNGATYYWQVRSCLDSDHTKCGVWSNGTIYYFYSTISPTYISPENYIYDKYIGGYNQKGIISSVPIKFDWSDIPGAKGYEIKFYSGSDYTFKNPIKTIQTTDGYYDADGSIPIWGSSFYWTVRACAGDNYTNCGSWSTDSSTGSFRMFYSSIAPTYVSPENNSSIDVIDKIEWSKIDGAKGYELKFCSNIDQYGACIGTLNTATTTDSVLEINSCKLYFLRANALYYWTVRACAGDNYTNCGSWVIEPTTGRQRYFLLKNDVAVKINSLPSPPNKIDILGPPIIFDWQKSTCNYGYQYYIKNNATGERKEWTTTTNSVAISFEDDPTSTDWFHQSDDRGYEWGIRFCADADLSKCGNANSSAWTAPLNFSIQRTMLTKDLLSIKSGVIDTYCTNGASASLKYFGACPPDDSYHTTGRRYDVYIEGILTSLVSFNPYFVDFNTEQITENHDFNIPVGEKLRLRIIAPSIDNGISWFTKGAVYDSPPAWMVKDATEIYKDKTPFPDKYLYDSNVNIFGNNYILKLGMAVTDPMKNSDKIEVKAFNAFDCMNGECSQSGEQTALKVLKDDQGWYIEGAQEGIVYVQVNIPELDTTQVVRVDEYNKGVWYNQGKISSQLGTFVVTVSGKKPLAEAGPDKTTFSQGQAKLDGSILNVEVLQPSEQMVQMNIVNPKFDPKKPVSSTNQPMVPKDYHQTVTYNYQYSWTCEKGTLDNPFIAQPIFTAPEVTEDTDVKCFLTLKTYKNTMLLSTDMPPVPYSGYPKSELIDTSTDHMIVKVLFNSPPIVKDLKHEQTDVCNSGTKASARLVWTYQDNDPIQKSYQIKVLDGSNVVIDTGKINSASTAYTATNLDYNKTYTWQVIAWDQNDTPSIQAQDSFTTPAHRAPTVDFSFAKVEDPDNPDIIKYQFTDNSSVYSGTAVYSWDFGDTTSKSSKQNPEHTYSGTGNYTVVLEVSDGSNTCSASKDLSADNADYIYQENEDINMMNQ